MPESKAYLVTYTVTNELEVVIHAGSTQEARQIFKDGEYDESRVENTFRDKRGGIKSIRRLPEEDIGAIS